MVKKVAVVIPYYHSVLTELEKVSYLQCLKKLSNHPIILLVPDDMPESEFPRERKVLFEKVPASWLKSLETYNQMMVNENFYLRFCDFEYILIYQLDAFVFSDRLYEFCEYGYDYIGAPWIYGSVGVNGEWIKNMYVGNGGFSLRKVNTFISVLRKNQIKGIDVPEDVFWSKQNAEDFKIAPIEIALQFSIETYVRNAFEMNQNRLPFGCHAWERYDYFFWEKYIREEGYYITTSVTGNVDEELRQIREKERIADLNKLYERAKLSSNREKITEYCDSFFQWNNRKIFLWGAGVIGKRFGTLLHLIGIMNFQYIDLDINKQGKMLLSQEINGEDILKKFDKDVCVIICVKEQEESILNIVEGYGLQKDREVFLYREWLEGLSKLSLAET